ncbi:hypothetical protein ILUMI_12485 [Ignelater luminosus]|uniref:Uncharacterized protein n=1 Tax=Ignelater luminosus TaxID=2038154 RepID=A0A8K0G9I2_IGNLU|nr:hypothetical protein ILUMI_12485 [Ignelater luminosus]
MWLTEVLRFSLVCVVIFNLPPAVTSLRCYECFSSISGNCGFDFVPTKAANKSCSLSETICYTEINSIKSIPVVTRNCGIPEICNTRDNCTTCSAAFCNSSLKNITFNFHYLAVILFSAIVIKWCLYANI